MQSYDLGCSFGGGSDPGSVLTDAGLSFVSQSQSQNKNGMTKTYFLHLYVKLLSFNAVILLFQALAVIHKLHDKGALLTSNWK